MTISTTYKDQEVFVKRLKSYGLKNSSINRYLAVLDSVGCEVQYLPVPQAEPRVLTAAELEHLDSRVRSNMTPSCCAVYAVLRDTGCRGLVELSKAEVDWSSNSVEYVSHKGSGGGMRRKVPLSEVAHRAFAWLHHHPTLPSSSEWRAGWLRARLDKNNKPYDLRHTFCTRLLDSGVPVQTVSKIMGHSDLRQTMHYYHLQEALVDDVRRALDQT